MSWYLFALISALMHASYFALAKKFLKNIDQYIFSTGAFLTNSIILFILSMIKGLPQLGSFFIFAVIITGTLNVIAATINFKALKITDLSLAIPMLSLTPVFAILTSFIFLSESPTLIGGIGILLIVIGSYVLNFKKDHNIFVPFIEMLKNKGIFFMLIVAFIWSISINFDKLAVLNSDPIFSGAVVYFFIGVSFLLISLNKNNHLNIAKEYKNNFKTFLIIGFVLALGNIAINVAFTSQIVPYVISLKRMSILFSVLIGAMFFKEKDIMKRSFASIMMVIGVILIILF